MYDTEIFGIQHPNTGQIGFCCIMGYRGEFIGMAVYKGFKGLNSYEELIDTYHMDTFPDSNAFKQECLMVSFGPYEELYPSEQVLLEQLGLSFPENSWPCFRDYSTGYMPWPIEKENEATFLLHAIQESIYVSESVKLNEEFLEPPPGQEETHFVRMASTQGESPSWKNTWIRIPTYYSESPKIEVNKLFLLSNCASLPRTKHPWLVDTFFFPAPTQEEGERPYFPEIMVIADTKSGYIIGHELFAPSQIKTQLTYAFIEVVKSVGALPSTILVSKYESIRYWEEIARLLQIPLEMDAHNRLIEEIKSSLFGSLPQ